MSSDCVLVHVPKMLEGRLYGMVCSSDVCFDGLLSIAEELVRSGHRRELCTLGLRSF